MYYYKIKVMFLIAVSCMVLSLTYGCTSTRFISSIRQQSLEPIELAGHKLKIVSVTRQQHVMPGQTFIIMPTETADAYMKIAVERYPVLFSNDSDALRVAVILRDESQSSTFLLPLITALLSVGTLPSYPSEKKMRVNAELAFSDSAFHELCLNSVRFERADWVWVSVYTPLGLIPVPGHSDLPKASGLFFANTPEASSKLTMISVIDAVVKAAHDCGVQAFNKVKKEM